MKHASLFTGIGGFDLAAQWMGWENVFQCEIDDYCNKLLTQNFPNTIKHGDIRTTDFAIYRGRIDVLSGGFPCQPYSTAGKRLGKEDERHLWPEMLRAIREIQPRWIVGENVRGLTNWNGGLVFDEVQADLAAAGYEVTPFLLPAAGVNAPHRRDRIFFIAYSESFRKRSRANEQGEDDTGRKQLEGTEQGCNHNDNGTSRAATYSAGFRRERELYQRQGVQRGEQACGEAGAGSNEVIANTTNAGTEGMRPERQDEVYGSVPASDTDQFNGNSTGLHTGRISQQQTTGIQQPTSNANGIERSEGRLYETRSNEAIGHHSTPHARPSGNWEDFPTQPGICGGNDGVPNRVHRLKGLGNAVVPQVVLQIFKAIQAYEDLKQ